MLHSIIADDHHITLKMIGQVKIPIGNMDNDFSFPIDELASFYLTYEGRDRCADITHTRSQPVGLDMKSHSLGIFNQNTIRYKVGYSVINKIYCAMALDFINGDFFRGNRSREMYPLCCRK